MIPLKVKKCKKKNDLNILTTHFQPKHHNIYQTTQSQVLNQITLKYPWKKVITVIFQASLANLSVRFQWFFCQEFKRFGTGIKNN